MGLRSVGVAVTELVYATCEARWNGGGCGRRLGLDWRDTTFLMSERLYRKSEQVCRDDFENRPWA